MRVAHLDQLFIYVPPPHRCSDTNVYAGGNDLVCVLLLVLPLTHNDATTNNTTSHVILLYCHTFFVWSIAALRTSFWWKQYVCHRSYGVRGYLTAILIGWKRCTVTRGLLYFKPFFYLPHCFVFLGGVASQLYLIFSPNLTLCKTIQGYCCIN